MGSKHEQIGEAAKKLFSERGYDTTSMRDIANAVGLHPGSLYAHLDHKEDLLLQIVTQVSDAFISDVIPLLQDPDLTIVEQLQAAMRMHVRVVADNLASATIFFHDWRALEGDRRELALKKRREYEDAFREKIAEGIEAGHFRALDPHLGAITLMSLLNWVYVWYSPDGKLTADEVGSQLADVAIFGLMDDSKA